MYEKIDLEDLTQEYEDLIHRQSYLAKELIIDEQNGKEANSINVQELESVSSRINEIEQRVGWL